MKRSRITTPVLLIILLSSLMPTLYIVQLLVTPGGPAYSWLTGSLMVSVEGQSPHILQLNLYESSDLEAQPGLILKGTGVLQEDEYPWKDIPFEGAFSLNLGLESQAPATGNFKMEWAASYSERLLSRPDGLGLPPLPCKGSVELLKSEKSEISGSKGLKRYDKLQLALDLNCTSAGADLLWSSGDEKVWTIRGPLALSSGTK